MNNIYLISGLGADESVFRNINFKNEKPRYISWIIPEKNESITDYCRRLLDQITESKDVILIGVSFGGIISIELSKLISIKQIIIISSIKTFSEKPAFYRYISFSRILNMVPSFLLKLYNPILAYYFGINSTEDKMLLKNFLINTNSSFIKWALKSILKWNNQAYPSNLVHIHGTKDRLFPFKLIHKPIAIEGGGHFMILNKHDEISKELNMVLKK